MPTVQIENKFRLLAITFVLKLRLVSDFAGLAKQFAKSLINEKDRPDDGLEKTEHAIPEAI